MAALSPANLPGRPYTIHDIIELNQDRWPRYEVLGGTLVVSPAPMSDHQIFGDNLQTLLVLNAPDREITLSGPNLRLGRDENGVIPDLVVFHPETDTARRTWFEADEALAVVEIVSPGNRLNDRVTKPVVYAESGIPFYVRVELAPFPGQGEGRLPIVLVHELRLGAYQEIERLTAGAPGTLEHPFPMSFDPADLLDPHLQQSLFRPR
ncbi:Uma2 family endonuclease [Actinomadura hibisca]|uniref:Uma2 family endonuclease n=1 Tax=Actinomadura hibisca TaxID=68565 RepID=UPI0008315718|nr:Uma2 family endonuclease [Actinomadura hibisca]